VKFCELCKHWDGKQCGHENRAFVQKDEYGCQYFRPKSEQAAREALRILKEKESKLKEETTVIQKWARLQLEKMGVNPERLARAIHKYWRLYWWEPRRHSEAMYREAKRLIRRAKSAEMQGMLSKIINEHERAKALEEMELARAHPKSMYWRETVRQPLVQRVAKFLEGDVKLAWLIVTSNKEDFDMILKTGRQQVWKRRREPRIPVHIKKYCKLLMARDLDISEVPMSVLDELQDRGLAKVSEEEGKVIPTEYLQLLFFDKKI